MSEETSEEDVLKNHKSLIASFDSSQKANWGLWSGRLPKRVATVTNNLRLSTSKVGDYQNYTYVCAILSAAIPIVVALLVATQTLSPIASLLDALFPAIVVVVQRKLQDWSGKREVYASVYSPYYRLLADVVVNIYKGEYANNEAAYNDKWDGLDQILVNARISVY